MRETRHEDGDTEREASERGCVVGIALVGRDESQEESKELGLDEEEEIVEDLEEGGECERTSVGVCQSSPQRRPSIQCELASQNVSDTESPYFFFSCSLSQ